MATRWGQKALAGTRVLHQVRGNINALRNRQRQESPVQHRLDLSAGTLADLCLGHLAEDPAQLAEFMTLTGFAPEALRRAIGSDQLGRGLIDYFAQNEPLMLALCANNGMRPEDFMRVWNQLNPAG
jgi:hypothetical protein